MSEHIDREEWEAAQQDARIRLTTELDAAEAEVTRLRKVIHDLTRAVGMLLARGEDSTPGDFDRAWKAAQAVNAEPKPCLACMAASTGQFKCRTHNIP